MKAKSNVLVLVCVHVLLLFASTPLLAILGREILVRGTVVDENGDGVKGAVVTVTRSDGTEFEKVVETNRKGRFKIFLLDGAHRFDVRVAKEGYQTTESEMEPIVIGDHIDREQGRGREARQVFRVQIEMHSEDAVRSRMAEEGDVRSAPSLFNEGIRAAQNGDLDAASAKLAAAVEQDPTFASAREALVKVLYESRRYEDAAEHVDVFLDSDAASFEMLEIGYHVHWKLGDLEAAEDAVLELWQKKPSRAADEMLQLATAYEMKQRNDAARPLLEAILEEDPDHATAHYVLGGILLDAGETDEGAEHLRRFLELDPDSPRAEPVRSKLRDLAG